MNPDGKQSMSGLLSNYPHVYEGIGKIVRSKVPIRNRTQGNFICIIGKIKESRAKMDTVNEIIIRIYSDKINDYSNPSLKKSFKEMFMAFKTLSKLLNRRSSPFSYLPY